MDSSYVIGLPAAIIRQVNKLGTMQRNRSTLQTLWHFADAKIVQVGLLQMTLSCDNLAAPTLPGLVCVGTLARLITTCSYLER